MTNQTMHGPGDEQQIEEEERTRRAQNLVRSSAGPAGAIGSGFSVVEDKLVAAFEKLTEGLGEKKKPAGEHGHDQGAPEEGPPQEGRPRTPPAPPSNRPATRQPTR